MMDLNLIFKFVKGHFHGNQIILPLWKQTDTMCILCMFARWSMVLVLYYLLGGDTAAPSVLYARLCHAFLVLYLCMISRRTIISGYTGSIFAIFSPNEVVLGADDRSGPFFRYLKGRCHGKQFCEKIAMSLFRRSGIPKWNGILLPKCAH